MENEVFLRYPPSRDILFFVGAGASHADEVPLQRHLLPTIMGKEIPEIRDSAIGKIVIKFINDNFSINIEKDYFPPLEAVFGFIDYFIQLDESLSQEYSNRVLRLIREYLIKLIHYVVDIKASKKSIYYHLFWELIEKYNNNVSIINLNYDTLLEQAFDSLFDRQRFIDYSIYLMNFEKVEQIQKYNFWVNPKEPIKVKEGVNPKAYKVLKLHGSLNWKYCNCCNQVLLTPWDRKIDLNKGIFLGYTYPENVPYEYFCPLDNTEFQTLILPPSNVKPLSHPVISQLFSEASREIRKAKKIVFIGYSLSHSDIHIKALLKKNIKQNCEIVVINTKDDLSFKSNYFPLSKNIKFIQSSFQSLVEDEILFKNILTINK
ncbi:MAG: SIR2 family protein [bacterium]